MQAAGVAESHQIEYEDLLVRGIQVKADPVAHFGITEFSI